MNLTIFWAAPAILAAACFGQDLRGVVDIHAHSDPDSVPRRIDAIDLARLAKSRGLRALVLKNHFEGTASMAYVVRKEAPGIEVFGGIALNLTVGGINPAAVERMTMVRGGWGKVVWMPTFDAENHVRSSRENRPFVAVVKGGQLIPEVTQVIALAAKHGLTLATGHASPDEALLMLREAHRQGVQQMVVTHAMLAPVRMTIAQMQAAVKEGAYIEFVYNALIGPSKEYEIGDYTKAIRALGVEHCILSSDLGQAANPVHTDGWVAYLAAMRKEGFTQQEIDRMAKTNPARALGLR